MADVPTSSVGLWLICAIAVVTGLSTAIQVVLGWRKLFAPAPIGAQAVTQDQLDKFASKADVQHLETALKELRTETEVKILHLEETLRDRVHDLSNRVQPMMSDIAVIKVLVRLIANKVGIAAPDMGTESMGV